MTFLLIILANCVTDESCGEKFAPISPRGPKFVAQIDFCVNRLKLCNKLNSAKFSKSFLTGKFCRGVTERVSSQKNNHKGCILSYSTVVNSISCRM